MSKLCNQYEPLSKIWNRKEIEVTELKNRKYRVCHLKKWHQNVDRLFDEMCKRGEFDYTKMPEMPSCGVSMLLKHEVEVALIETEIAEIEQLSSRLWRKMQSIFSLNRANTTYRRISKRKQRELESDTCAICYEEHNISQIVTIRSCGHSFGKSCFTHIINHCYDSYKEITCPCCRNDQIDMIRYRK